MRFKDERGKNTEYVRVGTRAGQYVVIEQSIANLYSRTITNESEQQAHALDSCHGTLDALLANLRFALTDVVQQTLRFDRIDDGNDSRRSQGSAAEGRAEIAGSEMCRDTLSA